MLRLVHHFMSNLSSSQVHLSVAGAHLSMLASTMPPRLNVLVHALLATASVCFDIACNLAKGDGTTLCHRGRCPAVTNTHQFLYSFGDYLLIL